jgi:hypothetical protein
MPLPIGQGRCMEPSCHAATPMAIMQPGMPAPRCNRGALAKPMQTSIAKIILLSAALTLAVPESYAKRMGSGRSSGRQSTITRQRSTPPPVSRAQPAPPPASPAPVQRSQPDMARQSAPPVAPQRTIPRQASSPWGGMLGGALLGLGLGSLLGNRDRDRDPNNVNQTEGDSGTNNGTSSGSSAAGVDETQAGAAQPAEQVPQNRFGSLLLLGALALAVYFLIRRARLRARGR